MSSRPICLSAASCLAGLLCWSLLGCSSSPGESGTGGKASGGTTANGGTTGLGGSGTGGTVASGGTSAAGGSSASGGAKDTGGTVGTGGGGSGGAQDTGGTPPGGGATGGSRTGGAAAGATGRGGSSGGGGTPGGSSAGASGTGGAAAGATGSGGSSGGGATGGSSGGARTGGATGRGGSSGSGGAAGGSSAGGSSAGGAGGSGKGSPGCGSSSPLKTGNFTESINGTTRKWMLDVPTNYDANKQYRMIFVWHPLSGNGSQIVNNGYNGLKSLSSGSAIFATADGLNGSNGEASGTGWWNANGGDMKLFQAMFDKINAGLCIDQERIFSTGFSFGGMMSYTLPFEFDVFRAVAPCSGKTGVIPYNEKFTDPVAIMAFHGDKDTFVATSLGKAFFDKFAARNKCGTQTQAVSPTGCQQYQGCVVPSTWCTFPGAHETWSEEPGAIWKFFSSF